MDAILKDVAIGLAVLFLGFAGMVTAVLELFSRALAWRAANLWAFIRKAVDDPGSAVPAGSWVFGTSATGGLLGARSKEVEGDLRTLLVRSKKRMNTVPGHDFARATIRALGDGSSVSAAITRVEDLSDEIPIKQPLLQILGEAEDQIGDAVDRLGDWFDEQMGRLTKVYARNMRIMAFMCGLVLAVAFNVNALDAFDSLQGDAALRAAGATAGNAIAETCAPETDEEKREECVATSAEGFYNSDKLTDWGGLFDDNDEGRHFQKGLWPIAGVGLSAGAICLGAPFWIDLLKRLTAKRSN